jgi:hypothetical protein
MYNAIIEVHNKLTEYEIPHIFRKLYDGYQIIMIGSNGDIIEHSGSYGSDHDLMEIMGLDWTVLEQYSDWPYDKDDVLGWLDVDSVLKICYNDYNKNIRGYIPM